MNDGAAAETVIETREGSERTKLAGLIKRCLIGKEREEEKM